MKDRFIIVGIIAQIASLIRLTGSSQLGTAFFNIFPQDKNVAAFVLSVIIIGQAIDYLDSPSRDKATIFFLSVMGLGFTFALTLFGGIREILGAGSIFGIKFVPADASTILLFILPPGAFIALGFLIAVVNKLSGKKA